MFKRVVARSFGFQSGFFRSMTLKEGKGSEGETKKKPAKWRAFGTSLLRFGLR